MEGEGIDGIVEGTENGDIIDANYTGDADGDRIDAGDNTLAGVDAGGTAGSDDDLIQAGGGNDTVEAGLGNDTAYGGSGNDSIHGDAANDLLYGEDGNDGLGGDEGDDTVIGGAGTDAVSGGAGNDLVYGDDTQDGATGDTDYVYGDEGDDTLHGGGGNDVVDGGDGNDLVDGGGGADQLTGGEGFDRFVAGNGDTITDFNTGTGQDYADGDASNNDVVDLSAWYNADNLAVWNAAHPDRAHADPLSWLRADQADGVLDDISTANGFGEDFTLTIRTGEAATDPAALTAENTSVLCFAADTLIETARGPVRAGDLAPGDLVRTRDAGLQPLRWVGTRAVTAAELSAYPALRPIRIAAGALAAGVPAADLVVSPQHRVLVRSRIAQKMFGTDEVLVAARQLCQVHGIDIAVDLDAVTYVHFLFDTHQIVFSNGAETESLHTGPQALKTVGPAALEEIFALFPELRAGGLHPAARVLASGRMGRKLAVRHARNGKALVS